jgi:hypothetical protein
MRRGACVMDESEVGFDEIGAALDLKQLVQYERPFAVKR